MIFPNHIVKLLIINKINQKTNNYKLLLLMFTKKSAKNAVKQALLDEESEVHEGGGLDIPTSINQSRSSLSVKNDDQELTVAQKRAAMESKADDYEKLEGLRPFNNKETQNGDMFKDLTIRNWIDTELDVVNVCYSKDSS